MKTILNISIAGMVAAGIYGFADFAKDLNNGNLIKYDKGEVAVKKDGPAPIVKETKNEKSIVKKMAAKAVAEPINRKTKTDVTENKKEDSGIDVSKMKLRYFSRGEPMVVDEEVVDPKVDVSSVVAGTDSVSVASRESNPK